MEPSREGSFSRAGLDRRRYGRPPTGSVADKVRTYLEATARFRPTSVPRTAYTPGMTAIYRVSFVRQFGARFSCRRTVSPRVPSFLRTLRDPRFANNIQR